MKGLITAGGRGTRLRPITHTKNKHLIPIAGKPLIVYAIEALKDAGITDIGITYNHDLESLVNTLGDGKELGVSITYIHQPSPIGLADCVRVAKDFIKEDSFVFFLGDNMVAGGISNFVKEFQKSKSNFLLLLAQVPDPQRFGVPVFDKKGNLIGVEEKPQNPKSNMAVTGIYIYDKNVFKAFEGVDAIKPSARGELEISDVHQYLIDHGFSVKAVNATGWWKDTGQGRDLLLANRLILEKHIDFKISKTSFISADSDIQGNISLGNNSKIINSTLRGPIYIGDNTVIENSYIGPFTSIENNNIILNSEIEHSIIFNDSKIFHIENRIDNSVIANNVIIQKRVKKPKVLNMMLGDHSSIEI